MTINYDACMNVLAGLNAKGQTRLEEALEFAQKQAEQGDLEPMKQLEPIAQKIKDGEYFMESGCGGEEDCSGWDGLDRRCSCGNRRVAWSWEKHLGWHPEIY